MVEGQPEPARKLGLRGVQLARNRPTGLPALAAASSAGVPCSSVAQMNITSCPRARM